MRVTIFSLTTGSGYCKSTFTWQMVLRSSGSLMSGGIWTSTNAGQTWRQSTAPADNWYSVASSANGTNVVAVALDGSIWTSTNSGTTWISRTNVPNAYWFSVASSCSGTNLFAADDEGGIWASTNSGVSWAPTTAPNEYWESVALSSDGTKVVAVAWDDGIWISTNSGAAWMQTDASSDDEWFAAACSADGTKMVAVVYDDGGIWSAQDIEPLNGPALTISHTANDLVVSWQNVGGWSLYQNAYPAAAKGWTASSGVSQTNGTNYMIMPMSVSGKMFFRLGR